MSIGQANTMMGCAGRVAVAPPPAPEKEPPKRSEVAEALQRMEKAMALEGTELSRLEDRIQPVLCREQPSPTGNGEEASQFSSPLAAFIENMAKQMEQRARDVSDLVDRIAL